mgnify:CR=1 FL=1
MDLGGLLIKISYYLIMNKLLTKVDRVVKYYDYLPQIKETGFYLKPASLD